MMSMEEAINELTMDNNSEQTIQETEIPLGQLCCFKPLDGDAIFFGKMAGKIVEDFDKMTFMYVLFCDDRYFYSKQVAVAPEGVNSSHEAAEKLQW